MAEETPLIEWARQFYADWAFTRVLDIGANEGDWSADMVQHASYVTAFEPCQAMFRRLLARVKSPLFQAYPVALGSRSNRVAFRRTIKEPGKHSMLANQFHTEGDVEAVDVLPLDVFPYYNVSFIKMDVEGSEADVLEGGAKFLERNGWPKILLERWSYDWFEEGRQRLDAVVSSLGYKMTPVNWYDMFLLER